MSTIYFFLFVMVTSQSGHCTGELTLSSEHLGSCHSLLDAVCVCGVVLWAMWTGKILLLLVVIFAIENVYNYL